MPVLPDVVVCYSFPEMLPCLLHCISISLSWRTQWLQLVLVLALWMQDSMLQCALIRHCRTLGHSLHYLFWSFML